MPDLRKLIAKLNHPCRLALENAVGRALADRHATVTMVHWLAVLADRPDHDLVLIMDRMAVDTAWQRRLLADAIVRMPPDGGSRPPALAPDLVKLVSASWLVASIDFDAALIRSGHILLAVLDEVHPDAVRDAITPLAWLNATAVRERFHALTDRSIERSAAGAPPPRQAGDGGGGAPPDASIH